MRRTSVAFITLVAGCAPATQRAYVAPTSETIIHTTEERQADPPEHLVFIENRSTVPVTVFSVAFSRCQNVKQRCEPQKTNLHVRPGQHMLAARVGPANPLQAWSYYFSFSWHPDSAGTAALSALAAGGDEGSRTKLAAMERADSIRRNEPGPRYNELTRDDFTALAARVASMRAVPDSLVIVPGEHANIERIRLVLVDAQGQVLGRTRWVRWFAPGSGAVQFVPPDNLIARRPGRVTLRFSLADEAQKLLANPVGDIEYAVVAAYPPDPHAPVFEGLAVDADTKKPLACARVALEDSAQNVVVRDRTGPTGTFVLVAPRPGTYRVRVETFGWAPAYGPSELANADEAKQHEYAVRFTEQLLVSRFNRDADDIEHARPTAVATQPLGTGAKRGASTPIVQAVTLGGSESMPILGIVGRTPPGTLWMQFVVDSTGRVDLASVLLPPDADARAAASVASVLPRVRFSPARDAGKPACELLRMQVNFSAQ